MRKLHSVIAVAVVAAAMVAAPAGAKVRKIEEAPYQHAAGILLPSSVGETIAYACVDDGGGCLHFQVPAGATKVSVQATDATGNPVALLVSAGDDGQVCGATEAPLALDPEFDSILVTVMTGTCSNGAFSLPTTGTVSVEFS